MGLKNKSLSLALATTLALSTASFGAPSPSAAQQLAKQLPTLQMQKPDLKIPSRLVSPENPSEVVRVIVELEKAPAIETATKKGKLYKDLSKSERKNVEAAIKADQKKVKDKLTNSKKNIKFKEEFNTVFNGFSAEVEAKDVASIAATEGVKAVYETLEYTRPSIEPNMTHSKELVQAQLAWEKYNFKGEGMVVGVIDTGIDPSHRDMVLSSDTEEDLTADEVNALLASGEIDPGKYFTEKVPYGYNYMDGNQQILDLGPEASMHGMHVSGTVGANGDETNGGIKGVAPEAQLLALKVFGNDPLFPSTFGDIYVKAMDDAIKLGADVLNLSLGSTAGYVDNSNPEQMAVSRAQDNGVLVAISAGNSDMFGSGTWYPYAENQDYGLTGSPSVSEDSFGVASFENDSITAASLNYSIGGEPSGEALYLLANNENPVDLPEDNYEIQYAGLGSPSDFEGKDWEGKFALVSRGTLGFVEKGMNAQAAGAAGIIIYNNAAGTINMASDPAIKIPYMFSLQEDGLAMKAGLDAGKIVTVEFVEDQFLSTPSPTAGQMSAFTSWGPTPNLDFKPEITAPGGNIFSTLNNDSYGLMSGTSMAAPHVAGGTALVMERVNEEFGLTGSDRVQLAKNLMMNTAKPVELKAGQYVSPRRQGAGIMQLANALETDVMVTNAATGEAKVALKEISNGQFSFSLNAKNFSDEEKTYNVNVQLQVDRPVNAGNFVTLPNNPAYGSLVLNETDATISVPATVTVPANGDAAIEVAVDASGSEWLKDYFTNGYFIDGFVTLEDPNEETSGTVPLTVPFFGFNGSWDDASIFDYNAWDGLSYWGVQGLADEKGDYIFGPSLGEDFDPSKFAFSPNGDGNVDSAIPVFSLIRNAKNFEVNILDADGNKVRTIRTATNLTKHYLATRSYTYDSAYGWDGMINGKPAADGQYQIQLRAVIDFEGAEWQSVEFPIYLDTKAPQAKFKFDHKKNIITTNTLTDVGIGLDRVEVYVNGVEREEFANLEKEYEIKNVNKGDKVTLKIWDIAGNVTEQTFAIKTTSADYEEVKEEEPGTDPGTPGEGGSSDEPSTPNEPETVEPVIYIDSPEYFTYHDSSTVTVSGSVEDDSSIETLLINGQAVQEFDGVNFSHTLTLADGFQSVNVKAVDEFGNEMAITRKIFVDTTKPTVNAVASSVPKQVSVNAGNPVIQVQVGDNFDEFRLYLNDSEVFYKAISEPYVMNGFTQVVDVELPLVTGQNTFELKVVDLVGHEATQVIKVAKQATKAKK